MAKDAAAVSTGPGSYVLGERGDQRIEGDYQGKPLTVIIDDASDFAQRWMRVGFNGQWSEVVFLTPVADTAGTVRRMIILQTAVLDAIATLQG